MARPIDLLTFFLTTTTAATLAAITIVMPVTALAEPAKKPKASCAERLPIDLPGIQVMEPRFIAPRDTLGAADELAALEVIQNALSDVADGATFVWHHQHGRLSAIINPTATFRNARGQFCRHVHLMLNSGDFSRKSEGIACRSPQGIWSLEG